MKSKAIIIISSIIGTLAVGLSVGAWAIAERNKDAKSPLGWCVERIKEKDLFEENGISGYAFEGHEAKAIGESPAYDKYYFVNIVYQDDASSWHEEWICGITHERTVWSFLKAEQITAIGCEMLSRDEL